MVLAVDPHQYSDTASALVASGPKQHTGGFHDIPHRSARNVAGTVCHSRHQSAARLPHVIVGNVLADSVGLGNVHWNDRLLWGLHVLVHTVPSHDFHCGNEGSTHRDRGG